MSIPTHNLYDFIHQITEKRFWLMYFYPWGEKNIANLINYQKNDDTDMINSSSGIPINNRIITKIFPIDRHHNDLNQSNIIDQIKFSQPVLLCHDQEPLNFDLYKDNSPMMISYLNKKYKKIWGREVCPLLGENLRYSNFSCQRRWILLHSEKNSLELKKYQDTGRYQEAFWWSHALIALDWYRYAEHDPALKNSSHKKLFLIYARAFDGTRNYRKIFLEKIKSIDNYCQIGSFDTEKVTADYSAVYQVEDFVNTDISVILETLFDDQRIHLTEKTLRPIACGHPFILAAGSRSLDYIRSYGFETFSPWINEDYDRESDHTQRLKSIVAEMRRISNLDKDQKNRCIEECKKIAARNQQHFFSKNFREKIIQELQKNVDDAYKKCNNELDFDFYLNLQRWKDINHIPRDNYSRSIAASFRKYVREHKGSFEQYQSHQHRLDDESSTDGHDV